MKKAMRYLYIFCALASPALIAVAALVPCMLAPAILSAFITGIIGLVLTYFTALTAIIGVVSAAFRKVDEPRKREQGVIMPGSRFSKSGGLSNKGPFR